MRRGVQAKLKHLNPSGRFPSGNVRYYYRPKGSKGIAMPDLPTDHPAFLAAYAKAAGVEPRAPLREGSLASGLALYKGSDAFAALAASTQSVRVRVLDDIARRYGHANRAELAARHIEADLSQFRGHVRNNRLKVWRGFCAWLQDHDGLARDPSDGIKRAKTAKSNGHVPWTADEIEAYRAHWQIGTVERLAFELIYWTGARVSDAVRLGPGNVDREGWLSFRQKKTGGEVSIPFDRPLPDFAQVYASDLAMLHDAIRHRPERHMTYLHTRAGASRSGKAVSQWFAARARVAGVQGKTAHGLRKARAKALAEAGGSAPQIGAWTGHESLKEIERYIRDFSKRQALSRTERGQKVPTSCVEFQERGEKHGKSGG
jgi:integrase